MPPGTSPLCGQGNGHQNWLLAANKMKRVSTNNRRRKSSGVNIEPSYYKIPRKSISNSMIWYLGQAKTVGPYPSLFSDDPTNRSVGHRVVWNNFVVLLIAPNCTKARDGQ